MGDIVETSAQGLWKLGHVGKEKWQISQEMYSPLEQREAEKERGSGERAQLDRHLPHNHESKVQMSSQVGVVTCLSF